MPIYVYEIINPVEAGLFAIHRNGSRQIAQSEVVDPTLDLSESRVSQMHTSIVQRLQEQLGRRRSEMG